MKCNLCAQKEATHEGLLKGLNFGPWVYVCKECYEKNCKEGGEINAEGEEDKSSTVSN